MGSIGIDSLGEAIAMLIMIFCFLLTVKDFVRTVREGF